jgi:hypothetical protein
MKKWDNIILASIAGIAVVLALGFWLMGSRSQTAFALISVGGKTVLTLDLAAEPDQQIDLSEYGVSVVLEIRNHQISFHSSDCPDHLCMDFGWIDHEPQSAVCMPNRVAIVISPTANPD